MGLGCEACRIGSACDPSMMEGRNSSCTTGTRIVTELLTLIEVEDRYFSLFSFIEGPQSSRARFDGQVRAAPPGVTRRWDGGTRLTTSKRKSWDKQRLQRRWRTKEEQRKIPAKARRGREGGEGEEGTEWRRARREGGHVGVKTISPLTQGGQLISWISLIL